MQEQEQQLLDQIRDLMRAKKYDELDTLWLEVLVSEPKTLSFHESVIRYLMNKKEVERVREMYGLFAEQSVAQDRFQHTIDVLSLLLQYDPAYTALRRYFMQSVRGLHADRGDRLDEIFRISELDSDSPDIMASMSKVEELLGASKGQVFKHSQWGLGIVRELDATEGWAVLDFEKKPNHRITLSGIKEFLQRIPNEHFLARIAKNPEETKREIYEDPCAAIRICLKNYKGKLKAPDLKKIFMTGFLTEPEFKKWWTKAKDEVRLDPHIDLIGKGASTLLVLRQEARSFADEIRVRLLEAPTTKQRRDVLRDVDKHGSAADMAEEDLKILEMLFSKPVADGSLSTDVEMMSHGLLFEEFRELFTEEAKNPVDLNPFFTRDRDDLIELIGKIEVFELQRVALRRVLDERKDASAILSEVFFTAETRLATWIEKTLEGMGNTRVMESCVERILSNPMRNTDIFIWAAKKVFSGNLPHVLESMSESEIILSGLQAMNDLESQAHNLSGKTRDHVMQKANKLRAFLQEGTLKHIKRSLRSCTADQARQFITGVNMMGNLTNQLRMGIEQVIFAEHPGLSKSRPSEEEEEQKTAIHYSTDAAVENRRQKLSHILNTEIPENSEQIGIAREYGDLKENAEYHAAKDRQKVLMQTAAELEGLISRAQIIDLNGVKTDQVRFGTKVGLQNLDTKETEECILLGMWEANADKKIISYLTPFGSQLMSRKVGEEFLMKLPDGREVNYRVNSIDKVDQSILGYK
ncbi:MAG: GreA/GreB family elongation factor [Sumerlaeia bacterium]